MGAHLPAEWLPWALVHELAQPIGALLLNAEVASCMAAGDTGLRSALADVRKEAVRAADLLDGLRHLASGASLPMERLAVADILRAALATTTARARARNVTTSIGGDGAAIIGGHAALMHRSLVNLMVNAIDALAGVTPSSERRLCMRVLVSELSVAVRVSDNGPGIPAHVRGRLFEPGVSATPGGLGLGLPISRCIVAAHSGTLELEESSGAGTTFLIRLPAQAP